ncbi:DUF3397 family protein [Ornithinibacillus californiensis]|uniref:DUF3397 family protein n=1 Tax=Ornithinibacillus californiensis TaxID=161536 RepID=UPI00064D95F2|nr:DUF3397 family protein [Ornithinibacillus californiensis]
MFEIILYVLASLLTLPILVTVLLYYVLKYALHNPIKAFHKAINWTTLLYIISVNVLLSYLFQESFIGYILILILCILTVLIIVQWKKNTEIDYSKATKLLWRFSFLLFFLFYLVLSIYGIVRNILV